MKRARGEAGAGPRMQGCAVCTRALGVNGSHQAASLKCGHLFGQSCLDKWVKKMRKGFCPTCHAKATPKDIRPVFIPTAGAALVDSGRESEMKRQMEQERHERIQLERKCAALEARVAELQAENKRLLELHGGEAADGLNKENVRAH